MAVTADVVQVRLEAQTRQYEQNLRRAEQTSTRAFGRISSSANNLATSFAGAFTGVQLGRLAFESVEAATRIDNALKVVGLSGQELERVYDSLFESAQRNLAPIETLATLYSRLGLAQTELGVTNSELLSFTDNIALALRVQGAGANEARGALIQLSQALGGGIVRAEEFNSVVEGVPTILRAAAAGLTEAGGSIAKLRQLVLAGEVSSSAFFRAFEAGAYILEDQVSGAEVTVSQGFVRLQNVLIDLAREMNEGSAITGVLVGELENLGEVITEVANFANFAVGPISEFVKFLQSGQNAAQGFANELGRITGLDQIGLRSAQVYNDLGIPGLTASSSAGGRVLDQTFSLVGETDQDDDLAALLTGRETALSVGVGVVNQTFSLLGETPQDEELAGLLLGKVDPDRATVSLKDYPVLGDGKPDAAARKAERERQAVLDLISTLEFERSLVGQSAREQEIANKVREAGTAATEAQIERIRELAGATYDAQQAQDRLNMSAEAWADTVETATRGFIDDLIAGKSAAEAFGNVLSRVADQFLTLGLNNLFGTGGFNLAGLFGGTSTRATGGPVYAGNPTLVGERGPEVFVPSGPGRIVPNSQVGGSSVTFAPVIDARGADVAAVARLEQSMQRLAADIVPTIRLELATAGKKGRTRG